MLRIIRNLTSVWHQQAGSSCYSPRDWSTVPIAAQPDVRPGCQLHVVDESRLPRFTTANQRRFRMHRYHLIRTSTPRRRGGPDPLHVIKCCLHSGVAFHRPGRPSSPYFPKMPRPGTVHLRLNLNSDSLLLLASFLLYHPNHWHISRALLLPTIAAVSKDVRF